eukprot:scaffold28267_cov57-Phaeocystis_antarctica.AAC.2
MLLVLNSVLRNAVILYTLLLNWLCVELYRLPVRYRTVPSRSLYMLEMRLLIVKYENKTARHLRSYLVLEAPRGGARGITVYAQRPKVAVSLARASTPAPNMLKLMIEGLALEHLGACGHAGAPLVAGVERQRQHVRRDVVHRPVPEATHGGCVRVVAGHHVRLGAGGRTRPGEMRRDVLAAWHVEGAGALRRSQGGAWMIEISDLGLAAESGTAAHCSASAALSSAPKRRRLQGGSVPAAGPLLQRVVGGHVQGRLQARPHFDLAVPPCVTVSLGSYLAVGAHTGSLPRGIDPKPWASASSEARSVAEYIMLMREWLLYTERARIWSENRDMAGRATSSRSRAHAVYLDARSIKR